MCGRVILTLSAKMIREILNNELDVNNLDIDDFIPRYNISPGQNLLSVIRSNHENRAGYINWKYQPSWSQNDSDGYKFINARSETIHEKVSFKESFKTKRCLVICNGFYEWKREDGKVPYLFYKGQLEYMTLGGIWNTHYDQSGNRSYGISIITTEANELMKPVHHRMPVIITKDQADKWLNQETSLEELKAIMQPIHEGYLAKYQVSTLVNNTKNDNEECIKKVV